MSNKKKTYNIKITTIHVPGSLLNIPLPIEIVGQEGEPIRALITLQDNYTQTEQVNGPGSYLVRTELPSGQRIAKSTIVPDVIDQQIEVSSTVKLDFSAGDFSHVIDLGGAFYDDSDIKQPFSYEQIDNKFLPNRSNIENLSPIRDFYIWRYYRPTFIYGIFGGWLSEPELRRSGIWLRESPSKILDGGVKRQWWEQTPMSLPHEFILPTYQVDLEDSKQWRPLLMQVTLQSIVDIEYLPTYFFAIIVCPPSPFPSSKVTILPTLGHLPHLAELLSLGAFIQDKVAPPLMAFSQSGNPITETLFSYVRSGALDAVRQAKPTLINWMQDILRNKIENPVHAILAAYALLRVDNHERRDWVANLANLFDYLPDGAIIYGWYLIKAGKAEQAYQYFSKALSRGLPMYSEGVRLLRDGLTFLRELYPENPKIENDAWRASYIANMTNLDSELTCVNLPFVI